MAARKEVTFVIRARDVTRRVFDRIGRRIARLRISLGSLIALGGFTALARQATNAATEIQGVSDRLGITAEQVQGLQLLAAELGVPFSAAATTIQRVNRNFGAALQGAPRLQEAFTSLGVALDPARYESPLDLVNALVEGARRLGIESRVVQDTLGSIADTEGLDFLQRFIRRGGGQLRVRVDELSEGARSAADIRELAERESQIRQELIQLQREFAQELRALLPTIVDLLGAINETVGLVNEFREGGRARDQALTTASENVSEALGLGRVREVVAGETELTGGRSLGAELFNLINDLRSAQSTPDVIDALNSFENRLIPSLDLISESAPGRIRAQDEFIRGVQDAALGRPIIELLERIEINTARSEPVETGRLDP